jgi:ubiquitin C-terminal hydrolase
MSSDAASSPEVLDCTFNTPGAVFALLPHALAAAVRAGAPPPSPLADADAGSLRADGQPDFLRRGSDGKPLRYPVDFDAVPAGYFAAYRARFGAAAGGPALERLVEAISGEDELKLDAYPQRLTVSVLLGGADDDDYGGVVVGGGGGAPAAAVTLFAGREWAPRRVLEAAARAAQDAQLLPPGTRLDELRMWLLGGTAGEEDRALFASRCLQVYLEAPARAGEAERGESRLLLEKRGNRTAWGWPLGDTTRLLRAAAAQRAPGAPAYRKNERDPLFSLRDVEVHSRDNRYFFAILNMLPTEYAGHAEGKSYLTDTPYTVWDSQPVLSQRTSLISALFIAKNWPQTWRSLLRVGHPVRVPLPGQDLALPAWVVDMDHSFYPPVVYCDLFASAAADAECLRRRHAVRLECEVLKRVGNIGPPTAEPSPVQPQPLDWTHGIQEGPVNELFVLQVEDLLARLPPVAAGELPKLAPSEYAPPRAPAAEVLSPLLNLTSEELIAEVERLQDEFVGTVALGGGGAGPNSVPGVAGLVNLVRFAGPTPLPHRAHRNIPPPSLPFTPLPPSLPPPPHTCAQGNTCFMNSILQCLAAVEPLSNFFMADGFVEQLNRTNRLGSGGQLGVAWAAFVRALRGGPDAPLSPHVVKDYVSKKAPQFVGFNQHDSEDFSRSMLDWLMEDTCRVAVKPTFAAGGGGGLSDAARAALAWRKHLSRNDSVVTDVFTGQFRSQLRCETCKVVSTSFDPFSSLALALPLRPVSPLQRRAVYVMEEDPESDKIHTQYGLHFDPAVTGPLTAGHVAAWLAAQESGAVEPNYLLSPAMVEAAAAGGEAHAAAASFQVCLEAFVRYPHSYGRESFFQTALVPLRPEELIPEFVTDWKSNTLLPLAPPNDELQCVVVIHVTRMPALSGSAASGVAAAGGGSASGGGGSGGSASGGGGSGGSASGGGGSGGSGALAPHPFAVCYFFNGLAHAAKEVLEGNANSRNAVFSSSRDPGVVPLPPGCTDADVHRAVSTMFKKHNRCNASFQVLCSRGGPLTWEAFFALAQRRNSRSFHDLVETLRETSEETNTLESNVFIVDADSLRLWEHSDGKLMSDITLWVQPAHGWRSNVDNMIYSEHDSWVRSSKGLPRSPATTLAECLALFQRPERLTEDNRAKCAHCGTREDAEKTLAIWKAPPVLTVHLKRFKTGPGGFYGGPVVRKNNERVDFPVFGLDLTPYVEGPPEAQALPEALWPAAAARGGGGGGEEAAGGGSGVPPQPRYLYDLFAVSHHQGGLSGGHYTATIQEYSTGKWYFCDDRLVVAVEPDTACAPSAYVLFYRRRDTLPRVLAEENRRAEAAAAIAMAGAGAAAGGGGGGAAAVAGVKRPRSLSSAAGTPGAGALTPAGPRSVGSSRSRSHSPLLLLPQQGSL